MSITQQHVDVVRSSRQRTVAHYIMSSRQSLIVVVQLDASAVADENRQRWVVDTDVAVVAKLDVELGNATDDGPRETVDVAVDTLDGAVRRVNSAVHGAASSKEATKVVVAR